MVSKNDILYYTGHVKGRHDPVELSISPNPFDKQTKVYYSAAVPGPVNLEVLDMSGKLICSYSGCSDSSGLNCLIWDGCSQSGKKVPPGMYIVRLHLGNKVFSDKVVRN